MGVKFVHGGRVASMSFNFRASKRRKEKRMEKIFRFIRASITVIWFNFVWPATAEILAYIFRNPSLQEDVRAIGQAVVAGAIISFMSISEVGFWTDLAMLLVGLFMIVRANRSKKSPESED